MDSIEIVNPDKVAVLLPRGVPSLTLVTCYPFYFIGDAPKRFIVHARLQQQVEAKNATTTVRPPCEPYKFDTTKEETKMTITTTRRVLMGLCSVLIISGFLAVNTAGSDEHYGEG